MGLLDSARDALNKAERSFDRMREAEDCDYSRFSDAWVDFINDLKKVCDKLEKACGKPQKDDSETVAGFYDWWSQHAKTREKDPLLRYVWAARNADNHGIEEIVHRNPSALVVGNPTRTGPGLITHIRIQGDQYSYGFAAPGQPHKEVAGETEELLEKRDGAVYVKWEARLIQVKSRSGTTTYSPPTVHLGEPVDPKDILDVASRALTWHKRLLEDAASTLGLRC